MKKSEMQKVARAIIFDEIETRTKNEIEHIFTDDCIGIIDKLYLKKIIMEEVQLIHFKIGCKVYFARRILIRIMRPQTRVQRQRNEWRLGACYGRFLTITAVLEEMVVDYVDLMQENKKLKKELKAFKNTTKALLLREHQEN